MHNLTLVIKMQQKEALDGWTSQVAPIPLGKKRQKLFPPTCISTTFPLLLGLSDHS